MRFGVKCALPAALFVAACVCCIVMRVGSPEGGKWAELESGAMRRKAAEEYSREYGWGGSGKYPHEKGASASPVDGQGAAESALVIKLRTELGADIGHAGALIRRLSERAVYERLMADSSDTSSSALLSEIKSEAASASRRLRELNESLRRYSKSASGAIANEYSKTLILYERAAAVYQRILSYVETAQNASHETGYESALASGYAAMAAEFRRMESEYEKAVK